MTARHRNTNGSGKFHSDAQGLGNPMFTQPQPMTNRVLSPRVKALKVLVVDDEHYMRKVTRTILTAIGVKTILEAPDAMAGIELARTQLPDLMIIDWEMPVIDGAQLVRMIRTPGEFPAPETPIIMLSAHSDLWRVVESARIGANEFVRKPVSIKTLEDRIIAVVDRPRPTVRLDGYYGPMPRRLVPIETFEGERPALTPAGNSQP
jgi:two-component system chemotaxis response regulator CheY